MQGLLLEVERVALGVHRQGERDRAGLEVDGEPVAGRGADETGRQVRHVAEVGDDLLARRAQRLAAAQRRTAPRPSGCCRTSRVTWASVSVSRAGSTPFSSAYVGIVAAGRSSPRCSEPAATLAWRRRPRPGWCAAPATFWSRISWASSVATDSIANSDDHLQQVALEHVFAARRRRRSSRLGPRARGPRRRRSRRVRCARRSRSARACRLANRSPRGCSTVRLPRKWSTRNICVLGDHPVQLLVERRAHSPGRCRTASPAPARWSAAGSMCSQQRGTPSWSPTAAGRKR